MGISMKSVALILLSLICWSVSADQSAKKANGVVESPKNTKAIPLHVESPVYPRRAERRGIEGWVNVGFNIKADGTTDNIEVLGSSIEEYFDDAAVEATQARTYKPATRNGKPVMEGNRTARYTFIMNNSSGGVSNTFLTIYKKASDAIENQDLELAKNLIDELDANRKRRLAEVCYLDMLKANYFDKKGDDQATLRHVERALMIANDVASKDIYINLLKQGIVDNGKANNFHTSLAHYNTLLEVDDKLPPNDPIHKFASRLEQILKSDSNIPTTGTIEHPCRACEAPDVYFWWHDLNRNRFLLDQVAGSLDKIEIVCESSSVSVVYQPETAWTVNKDGGDCSIRVIGDKNTTFRLIELANNG